MPTLTIDYVYFGAASTHPRRPRPSNAYGCFAPIDALSGLVGTLQDPSSFQVQPGQMLPTVSAGGITYKFSFVNVSGGTPSGLTSFDPTKPTAAVTVGGNPIVVLVVYVPTGNGGPPGRGAYIDSFDETLGKLVSDDFVKVSPDAPPPPGGKLTTSGNVDGWVDTTTTETITAITHITPTGADFDRWVDMGNPLSPPHGEIAGPNFTASRNTNYYALAFYKSPPPPPPPDKCHALANEVRDQINKTGALNIPLSIREKWKTALMGCERELGAAEVNSLLASLFPSQPPPKGSPGKQ